MQPNTNNNHYYNNTNKSIGDRTTAVIQAVVGVPL